VESLSRKIQIFYWEIEDRQSVGRRENLLLSKMREFIFRGVLMEKKSVGRGSQRVEHGDLNEWPVKTYVIKAAAKKTNKIRSSREMKGNELSSPGGGPCSVEMGDELTKVRNIPCALSRM